MGGGCALVLGEALAGAGGFEELCALAEVGDRRRVDLLLGDIYGAEDTPIRLDATAAHLAKMPRRLTREEARRADLADAVWGLIGDNLGLLAGAIAGCEGLVDLVLVGGALEGNASLRRAVGGMVDAHGLRAHFLDHSAHAGARGALERAAAR